MRVLFMHNTLPEYRIKWFQEISNRCECKFIFTNEKLNQQVYGTNIKYDNVKELNTIFLKSGIDGYREIKEEINRTFDYDFVLFPPIDSIRELIISLIVYSKCKKKKIYTGYFWEKWEAPKQLQPFLRKIKNWLIKNAAALIFKKVDIVFAGGSKSKEYFYINGVSSSKIVVLPDSSEVPDCEYVNIRKLYDIKDDKILLLYFGRIFDQKGLDILLKALEKINDKEKYFLIVAGDGDYRSYCEELTQKLNLENVKFVGAIDPEKRKNFFEQSDIFVFPGTFRDGRVDVWGLTLNEAMQFNKVLISTTAVGSAYDLIDNGINGYQVEAESIGALSNSIMKAQTIINSKELSYINALYKEKYTFKNMADIMVNKISERVEM